MHSIKTEKLMKKYGEKIVVNEVDLTVKKGIIFGFLGKNGAGKSTFINMITGLSNPTSGEFKLDSSKEKIGVLPDYSSLYDDLTALEHLIYFNKLLKAKKKKKDLIDILKKVGLDDAINLKAKKFSFGMKKKLALAQTLINDPEIIFLDEPTSGVDANSILTIHNLIVELSKKGTTIFFTSHNLDEVEKISDEIAIMDKGSIKIKGNVKKLKEEYTNEIQVNIEFLDLPNYGDIKKVIGELGVLCNSDGKVLNVKVNSKKDIVDINKILVENNYPVYEISIYEPTLEEIFINSGQS